MHIVLINLCTYVYLYMQFTTNQPINQSTNQSSASQSINTVMENPGKWGHRGKSWKSNGELLVYNRSLTTVRRENKLWKSHGILFHQELTRCNYVITVWNSLISWVYSMVAADVHIELFRNRENTYTGHSGLITIIHIISFTFWSSFRFIRSFVD